MKKGRRDDNKKKIGTTRGSNVLWRIGKGINKT